MEFSNHLVRVNVNKHLTTLLSGYQDLSDRYGNDDPLVLRMKDEIERRKDVPAAGPSEERRRAAVRSGVWNRQPQRVSTRP